MFYSSKLTCSLPSSVDLHDQVHLDAAVALRKRLSPGNEQNIYSLIFISLFYAKPEVVRLLPPRSLPRVVDRSGEHDLAKEKKPHYTI